MWSSGERGKVTSSYKHPRSTGNPGQTLHGRCCTGQTEGRDATKWLGIHQAKSMMQISHEQIVSGERVPLQGRHGILFVCPFKRFGSQHMLLTFITYSNARNMIFNKISKIRLTTEIIWTSSLQTTDPKSPGNTGLAFLCGSHNWHVDAGELRVCPKDDREAAVHGVAKSQTWLSDQTT